MKYDLLIKGGEIVDPSAGFSGQMDVAIKRNRIAAVETDIPADAAFRVVDASGQYVTPGLVDLHTHVYYGSTFWGVHPDQIAARTGVTTWLDVGSAGAYNLPGLRDYIANSSAIRIYALLNISSIGLTAESWELANLNYLNVDLCCDLVNLNRDFILGIKARIDTNTVGENDLEPLRRAREAADRVEMPLMVHIGEGPPEITDILDYMRPGDILTHCFTGRNMRIIDDEDKLLEVAKRAWDAGIIMDTGHGAGSFSFETAEKLIATGYKPDVISSDIHQISIHGPLFDMPTCMSKFLALGMTFTEVIRASTSRPAEALGLQDEIGTLKPGAFADVALFRIEEGNYPFYDVHMNMREGQELISNTLTIVNGQPMTHIADNPPAPWIELSESQRLLAERGHTPSDFRANTGDETSQS
jgi:dihydroorotase